MTKESSKIGRIRIALLLLILFGGVVFLFIDDSQKFLLSSPSLSTITTARASAIEEYTPNNEKNKKTKLVAGTGDKATSNSDRVISNKTSEIVKTLTSGLNRSKAYSDREVWRENSTLTKTGSKKAFVKEKKRINENKDEQVILVNTSIPQQNNGKNNTSRVNKNSGVSQSSKKERKKLEKKQMYRNVSSSVDVSTLKIPRTPVIPQSQEKNDTRPLLVLHIGPHKTGSSTIQCDLTYHQQLLRKMSSFNYFGRVYGDCTAKSTRKQIDTRKLIDCLDAHGGDKGPCNKRKAWKAFEKLLRIMQILGGNVLISDEAFARVKWTESNFRLLKKTCSTYGFRIKVVVVYRRYYEWLLSTYNERYKPKGQSRKKFTEWPGSGGQAIIPFPDFFRRVIQSYWGIDKYHYYALKENMHPTDWLKKKFEKYFDDVVVFNMHQQNRDGDDLLTTFISQTLPGTNQFCDALKKYKKRKKSPSKANPSLNLDYDIFAVSAYEKGLVKKDLPRRSVAAAIEEKLRLIQYEGENSSYSLPIACLSSEEEEFLLNRSISFERQLFPYDDKLELDHRSYFASAARNHKFCNVDTDEALTDSWDSFFKSISKI